MTTRIPTSPPAAAGGVAGYDIDSNPPVVGTLGDAFDAGTLDGKWTPLAISPGTVTPVQFLGTGSIYDLATRSGDMLVQVAPDGVTWGFRQDSIIANGESLVLDLVLGDNGVSLAGQHQIAAGFNSSDIDPVTGNYFVTKWDGSEAGGFGSRIIAVGHLGLTGTMNHVAGNGRILFRWTRVAGTPDRIYAFVSIDGRIWTALGRYDTALLDNFWIWGKCLASGATPDPIISIMRLTHVTGVGLDLW